MSDEPTTTRPCSTCGDLLPLTADYFYRSKKSRFGFQSSCKRCQGATGARVPIAGGSPDKQRQVRRTASEREPARQFICSACASLPHRRPAGGCPSCGKPRVIEVPVSLEYGAQFPSGGNRTVYPNMGDRS